MSDVLASLLDREPQPLARFSPGVPADLERIIRKALAKDRDERYQTAKDLLIDMRALTHELERKIFESETPPPIQQPSKVVSSRISGMSLLLGLGIPLLVLLAGLAFLFRDRLWPTTKFRANNYARNPAFSNSMPATTPASNYRSCRRYHHSTSQRASDSRSANERDSSL
jgi:hypothetical protein